MSKLTRDGVCYHLAESPYRHEWKGYTFFFSSHSHRYNFVSKVRGKELWLTDSMTRRFHFLVAMDLVAVFQLYNQIETRGFWVERDDGSVIDSLDSLRFSVNEVR